MARPHCVLLFSVFCIFILSPTTTSLILLLCLLHAVHRVATVAQVSRLCVQLLSACKRRIVAMFRFFFPYVPIIACPGVFINYPECPPLSVFADVDMTAVIGTVVNKTSFPLSDYVIHVMMKHTPFFSMISVCCTLLRFFFSFCPPPPLR